MNLEDFDKPKLMDIQDFSSPEPPAVTSNQKSNNNKALMSIAISGDEESGVEQYENSMYELQNFGISETIDGGTKKAQEEAVQSSEGVLVEDLLDRNIDDQTKLGMAEGFGKLKEAPPSTQELFIESNLIEDGGYTTEDAERVRSLGAKIIKPYWEYQSKLQLLANSRLENLETSTIETIGEALEYWLIPFAEGVHTRKVLNGLLETTKSGKTADLINIVLAGDSNIEIKELLKSLPFEARIEIDKAMLNVLKDNSGIIFTKDNQFVQKMFIEKHLLGEYSTTDQWIDNAAGVLTAIPIIGTVLKVGKTAVRSKALFRALDLKGKTVAGASAAASVGKVAAQFNPIKGWKMADESMKDPIAAEKLFDSTPQDVAVEFIGPKPATPSGVVDPIPARPKKPVGDEEVLKQADTSGQIEFTAEEKASAVKSVTSDFQNVVGIQIQNAMTQVFSVGGTINIKAAYTSGEAGWSSAKEAKEQVMLALRSRGVSDSEVVVLKREPSGYVKKDNGTWEKEAADAAEGTEDIGDYIVQVNYTTKTNPNDVSNWSGLDVKNNFMDRVGALVGVGKAGSFSRHLLDIHSMLNPILTMSANVVVDKGALISRRITDLGDDFTKTFKKMSSEEKSQVDDYIKKANLEGLEHTPVQLHSMGFTPEAIKALTSWRKTWDTVYWLKNADLVKNLRGQGYQSLRVGNNNLLVRKKSMEFNNKNVYNPETGELDNLSKAEMRKLYDEGGYVGQSRTVIDVDGVPVENVLVRNNTKSYAKGLRETDQILEYRKGYYEINYDAPIFIDKIVRGKNGEKLYTQAVGMARDNVEARLMLSKWAKAENKTLKEYGDIRPNKNNERMSADDDFDIQMAQGLISQRARGKRLQEPTQPFTSGLDNSLVQDPIDALTSSARSIGAKVPMRDWLSTAKTRFIDQYGDFLPEVNGVKTFPRSIEKLQTTGTGKSGTSKEIADARTTWEYINYMEGGYVNSLDDSIKGTFRAIGNIMGDAGYGKSQRVMEWMASGRGVTGTAKGTAFQLYLALNPLRQILVQSHQMVRLAAINPEYVLTEMMKDLAEVQGSRLTGESTELHKFVVNSGQLDMITRSNLLNDSLTEITHQASQGVLGKVKEVATRISRASQKGGFEFGESNNVITSLLSFRNQAIKNGDDLSDPAVLDNIYAQARNYTYNMTKAGDMPYNQNAAGIVMQFLQVPHKAMTQTLFNRALTNKQKASALTFDTVMFGVPAYWAADKWFGDVLPEDPVLNEAIKNGIEGMMFNSLLNLIADDYSELDWTSLSATSAQGFGDLFVRVTEEGIGGLVTKSPSGQLVFGNNPRISNAIKNIAIFSGAMPEYEPVELLDVVKGLVSMASGLSNGFKSRLALKTGQMVNSSGKVILEEVTTAEGLGLLWGLPPDRARKLYETEKVIYEKSKAFKDDMDLWYKELKRQMYLSGDNNDATESALKSFSAGWLVFGDDEPEARKYISGLIKRDLKTGNVYLIERLFKLSGITPPAEFKRIIGNTPLSEEEKKIFYDIADQTEIRKSGED